MPTGRAGRSAPTARQLLALRPVPCRGDRVPSQLPVDGVRLRQGPLARLAFGAPPVARPPQARPPVGRFRPGGGGRRRGGGAGAVVLGAAPETRDPAVLHRLARRVQLHPVRCPADSWCRGCWPVRAVDVDDPAVVLAPAHRKKPVEAVADQLRQRLGGTPGRLPGTAHGASPLGGRGRAASSLVASLFCHAAHSVRSSHRARVRRGHPDRTRGASRSTTSHPFSLHMTRDGQATSGEQRRRPARHRSAPRPASPNRPVTRREP
jgi:hypothetical protein